MSTDVVFMILEHISGDYDTRHKTLCACRLVSRTWDAVSCPTLFRDLNITLTSRNSPGSRTLAALYAFLSSFPHIRDLVRDITIVHDVLGKPDRKLCHIFEDAPQTEDIDLLTAVLSSLPFLARVTLDSAVAYTYVPLDDTSTSRAAPRQLHGLHLTILFPDLKHFDGQAILTDRNLPIVITILNIFGSIASLHIRHAEVCSHYHWRHVPVQETADRGTPPETWSIRDIQLNAATEWDLDTRLLTSIMNKSYRDTLRVLDISVRTAAQMRALNDELKQLVSLEHLMCRGLTRRHVWEVMGEYIVSVCTRQIQRLLGAMVAPGELDLSACRTLKTLGFSFRFSPKTGHMEAFARITEALTSLSRNIDTPPAMAPLVTINLNVSRKVPSTWGQQSYMQAFQHDLSQIEMALMPLVHRGSFRSLVFAITVNEDNDTYGILLEEGVRAAMCTLRAEGILTTRINIQDLN